MTTVIYARKRAWWKQFGDEMAEQKLAQKLTELRALRRTVWAEAAFFFFFHSGDFLSRYMCKIMDMKN